MLKALLNLLRYHRIEKLSKKEIQLHKHLKKLLDRIDLLFRDPGNMEVMKHRSDFKQALSFEVSAKALDMISKAKDGLKQELALTKAKEIVVDQYWADVDKTMNELMQLQEKKKKLYFKISSCSN